MRYLLLIVACLAMVTPSCRHHLFAKEGTFTSAGCRFVHQDANSRKLSTGDAKGELIGRIRSKGIDVRVQPIRLGSYSRYTLRLTAEGGERGTAELAGRSRNRFAIVHKTGAIAADREAPEQLPKDWVCLLSMEGNLCLMAWNRRNGGVNHKFHARGARRSDAVYKVLELDDPRYHHDGVPLKELGE